MNTIDGKKIAPGLDFSEVQVVTPNLDFSTSNNSKMVKKYRCTYNGRLIASHLWSIEWRHFQWPWIILTQILRHVFIRCWISQNPYEIHILIHILWLLYTNTKDMCSIELWHREWPLSTLKVIFSYFSLKIHCVSKNCQLWQAVVSASTDEFW